MGFWKWLLGIVGSSTEPTLSIVGDRTELADTPPSPLPVKRGRRRDEKRHFYIFARGASFYQDGIRCCVVGEQIRLIREPNNPFSTSGNSILICRLNGQQLGHVPHEISADLAPAMDAGQQVRSEVDAILQPDKEQQTDARGRFMEKYRFFTLKVRVGLLKDPSECIPTKRSRRVHKPDSTSVG